MVMQAPDVISLGENLQTHPLDETEQELLDNAVFGGRLTLGNSWLQDLFNMNRNNVQVAAQVAKDSFRTTFKGLTPGDGEFGVSLIRPGYVLRSTNATETPQNDWTFTFTADEDNWIGFGADNATPIHVDDRLCLLPLGIWFTQGGPPLIEEMQFIVGRTTFPAQVLRQAWLADNSNRIRACPIHPSIWKPKVTARATTYGLQAGDQEMVLVGLAFVQGDLARDTEPTSVQT